MGAHRRDKHDARSVVLGSPHAAHRTLGVVEGEPFRTISAWELFARLLCIVVFGGARTSGRKASIRITSYTNNLGTPSALSKLMTSKFPLLLILAELAAQLKDKELDLGLEWIPRDQNEEADALTNGRFGDFDPGRRIDVDLSNIQWLILPQMAAVSEDIHTKFTEKCEQRRMEKERAPQHEKDKEQKAPKFKSGERVRARDPWCMRAGRDARRERAVSEQAPRGSSGPLWDIPGPAAPSLDACGKR